MGSGLLGRARWDLGAAKGPALPGHQSASGRAGCEFRYCGFSLSRAAGLEVIDCPCSQLCVLGIFQGLSPQPLKPV